MWFESVRIIKEAMLNSHGTRRTCIGTHSSVESMNYHRNKQTLADIAIELSAAVLNTGQLMRTLRRCTSCPP